MKHIKRLNINYILFIISYLTFYANCYSCEDDCKRVDNDCVFKSAYLTGDWCLTNCRPNLYNKDSEKCYTCNNNNGQYFYFNYEITERCGRLTRLCTVNTYHTKTIYGTNQCVTSCGSHYYEMGRYCFADCVGGNREEVDSSIKQCKCRYLYYIINNEYICLDQNKYCESYHHSYDYDTKLCLTDTNCETGKKYYTFHREGDSQDFKRCSNTCLPGEYIDETDNDKCVTSCGNKYYIENKKTKEKKCTSTCDSNIYVIEGQQCIEKDDCKYINYDTPLTSKCLTSCTSPYYITKISNRLHCSKKCQSQTLYLSGISGDNVCVNKCPSTFYDVIDSLNTCISITTALTCYYTSSSNPRRCLPECPSNYYHNVGSYECRARCTGLFLYHKRGNYTCYPSCDLIPGLGKNYIITTDSTGSICDCILYAIDANGKTVCYNNEEECYSAGYQRKLGNRCIKETECQFKVEGENNSGYLKKCFSSTNDCKTNNYPYYYSTTGTCWASCPNFIYASTSNQPTVYYGNTCVPKCTGTYIYYSTNSKICKTECDVGEYINPTETTYGKECLSSCSSEYIGEKDECYTTNSCPDPLYKITKSGDNTKNKCVAKCADYGKYYDSQDTTKTCKDSCTSGQFYNSDNQCLTSCSDSANVKISTEKYDYVNPALTASPCLTSSQITNLYYYTEAPTKIYSTCDIFGTSDSRIICSYCTDTSQYVYNNYCVTECPLEAPYYRKVSKTFSLTNKAVKDIKNCISSCTSSEYIVEYSNECVTSCPTGHTLNSSNKKCFKNCESGYFNPNTNLCVSGCTQYYEKSSVNSNYICKSSCSVTHKYLNGSECVSACTSPKNKVGLNNECKNACAANDGNYELDIGNSMIKCLFSCPAVNYIFYVRGQNKCLDKCPSDRNYFVIETTANNYECRTSCPYDYPFYLSSKKNTTRNYYACTKSFPCSDTQYYYNGACQTSCKGILASTAERRICVSGCNTTEGYTYIKKIENGLVTECKKNCDNDEYIIGNECYDNCPDGTNYLGTDKKCFGNCAASGVGIKYYLFSNPSGYKIYKCVESCPPEFPLLDKGTNECVKACSSTQYLSSEENICYNANCLTSSINNFTLDYGSTKKCFYKCDETTNYKFYYTVTNYGNRLKCLDKCSGSDYAYEITNICIVGSGCATGYYRYTTTSTSSLQKNFCVTQCPSDKSFIDQSNICTVQCSGDYIYYVREFIHGETDTRKRCLNDCPINYKFYVENADGTKECFSTCDEGYYVDPDTDKNAIRCLPTCPYSSFPYYYILIDEKGKKCVGTCPTAKRYHLPGNGNECLEACPDFAKFNKNGDVVCYNEKGLKDNTNCISILYSSKECYPTNVCGTRNTSLHSESGLTICLDKCIPEYGEYLTPFKTCVKDCNGPELFINDIQNKKCICENFYIIKSSQMKCLQNSLGKKKCKYVDNTYSINVFGSKECINSCSGKILSPSGDTCYEKSYIKNNETCSLLVDKNSYYTGTKCDCKYNFYQKPEEKGQEKICLDKNGECPLDYKKYVPSTKECVITCPSDNNILFKNLCLSYAPSQSTNNGNVAECNTNMNYWYYSKTTSRYVCDSSCPTNYLKVPLAKTSILCLDFCSGTHYPYSYNGKCFTSCANNDLLDIVNGFEVPEKPSVSPSSANHTCKCLNPWYNDKANNKIICSDSKYPFSISDCKNFTNPQDFKYMVKHTLECIVGNCPSTYPYHFNKECFKDCENDASSFYHYLIPKKDLYECECKNLWFINNQTNKSECIEIDANECIKFSFYFKYKINETRQCVSECPKDTYSFNYVCYNSCPENTTKNETDSTCICNTSLGYWYRYEKDNGTNYLRCVLDECPKENNMTIKHARKNLVEENSQCLISCSENYKFKYSIRDICREECPYFTDLNEEKDECVFFDLNNENNITNLTLLKDAANVQIKELYEGSEHLGGYLYNRFNASLHFYATDLKNTLTDISFKSNLTYIDLSTCIQKIYDLDNETYLNENHTILIAKYDLITNTLNDNTAAQIINNDKYLINKVEYELFSSNMSEKLIYNSSTCGPYELIVSYPLTLNRFNNYIGGLNQNEYRKKFEIGKKLYLRDNNIDTFNFNNTVYKNFCRSLEIDGKDLIFEDRYKYLYPNDKILCESNCIMNNTNFELERMICLCSLKDDFNISRQDDQSIDIFNDPYITLPTQSKYNAEAVKCLFNFSLNETIFYNEAFYYSSIITVVQISMMFISGFSGVKNVIGNIRHLLSKFNSKKSFGRKNNNTKRIKYKDNNIISTTNRPLNNPPKKDKYKEKYNEDIDFDSDEGDNKNIIINSFPFIIFI